MDPNGIETRTDGLCMLTAHPIEAWWIENLVPRHNKDEAIGKASASDVQQNPPDHRKRIHMIGK